MQMERERERESFLGRGHGRCEGPEAGERSEYMKNRNEAGGKKTESRVTGGDV